MTTNTKKLPFNPLFLFSNFKTYFSPLKKMVTVLSFNDLEKEFLESTSCTRYFYSLLIVRDKMNKNKV